MKSGVCMYVEMSSTIYLKTAVLQKEEGWTCNIHDSGSIHSKVERYLQTKTQRSVQCITHNFIPKPLPAPVFDHLQSLHIHAV